MALEGRCEVKAICQGGLHCKHWSLGKGEWQRKKVTIKQMDRAQVKDIGRNLRT